MDTEADTCRRFIVPMLQGAGWDEAPFAINEQRTFTDGRVLFAGGQPRRGKRKRADYILRYRPDYPIAVIEAKAEYRSAKDGVQQARDYAEVLGLRFAYAVWEKNTGTSGSIPEAETKAAVLARVTQKAWEATPVDGGNSPWAILPPGRFQDMANIQGKSDWIAGRKGITTDLNGVYMVRVIAENAQTGLVQVETRPEAGKTDIGPARTFWIEPTLLYPLLKGAADFSACHVHINEQLYVLVPNTGINKADYIEADRVLNQLPQTKRYFQHFQALLGRRSTYRQRQSNAPSHVVYDAGAYTFAPYKVVWAELSNTFEAAVVTDAEVPLVGRRPFVPDHKVYFADFDDEDEAYFVAGTLNSSLIQEYVESHTIQIQVSNIFKHLRIPTYDRENIDHQSLVRLTNKAHAAVTSQERQGLLAEIDELADRVLISKIEA